VRAKFNVPFALKSQQPGAECLSLGKLVPHSPITRDTGSVTLEPGMESYKVMILVMVGVVMVMPFGVIPLLRSVERQKKEWNARPAPLLPKVYISDKWPIRFELAILGLAIALFVIPGCVIAMALFTLALSDPLAAVGGVVIAALMGLLVWAIFRGVKSQLYRLSHPDRLVLSADGICCDSLGVRRQWRWDQIEGARGRSFGRYNSRCYLALKLRPGVDPQRVRGEPRIGHCTQAFLPQYWEGTRFNRDAAEDIAADIRAVMRAQGREPLSAWLESQDWPGQIPDSAPVSR
jgi:hypothetical protein